MYYIHVPYMDMYIVWLCGYELNGCSDFKQQPLNKLCAYFMQTLGCIMAHEQLKES